MGKLTKKQQTFVDEYLIDLNATQAAIRAGYSTQTAKDIACENLAKPNIKNAIDQALAARSKRTGVNQDRVIQELAKIAFLNPSDVINMQNASVLADANKDDLSCISSVKIKKSSSDTGDSIEREIKTYDKLKALDLLGRHLGMFNDKIKIEGSIPVVIKDDLGEDDD
ncbi:MAG: terminase small subunit [Candidatus Cloacimonetes bacterium]|nr:terminase small subunit [Candidatus Cloacimonadota bacterium]